MRDRGTVGRKLEKILKVILIGIVAIGLFGWVVKGLWNWLMPAIFAWHAITFWQAVGLVVLCKILFGGFRGGPRGGMHWRRRMGERWQHMSPEEREKFSQAIAGRCGWRGFRSGEQRG